MKNRKLPKKIFILGHMRSRSSLLAHIIMNHPQIYGIGESNTQYSSRLDLVKMRIKVRIKFKMDPPLGFTLLDQINHNHKTPKPRFILDRSKVIMLARRPEEAYRSIRDLTKEYYEEWSHDCIENYYQGRLKYLLNLKSNMDNPHLLCIDSQALIEKETLILGRITKFLALDRPLTSTYQTYDFSGLHGDPSVHIKSGVIRKKINQEDYDQVISPISIELFERLVS